MNEPKPYLNPNEMAFRKPYQELLLSGEITTVFRPGRRLPEDPRGYRPGQLVTARVLDRLGNDERFIPPTFVPDIARCIRIDSVEPKRIDEMAPGDFSGASPDVFDQTSLRFHLGLIYNRSLGPSDEITIIRFTHMNDSCPKESYGSVMNLVKAGIATLATQPKSNADRMKDVDRYTVTFIEHDYPARTPAMWNAAYEAFSMVDIAHMMYVAPIEETAAIVHTLRDDPMYLGGGFGVGFKDEVIAYTDDVEPIARKIGAANVAVKSPDGSLTAYNTDGFGFVAGLENILSKKPLSACKIVILGAGGTANAIAFSLAKKGARIVVINRTIEKAQALSERINTHFNLFGKEMCRAGDESTITDEVRDADVIVNASTKGSTGKLEDYIAIAPIHPGEDSLSRNRKESTEIMSAISKAAVVSDVVLRNGDTPLINLAKELGYATLDGIPMVVNQGVEAFWLVHGEELTEKGIKKEALYQVMKGAAGF